MTDITNAATNTSLNAKINEVTGKIPSIINLTTTSAGLTTVQNKIPNVSDLVKKADYDAKIQKLKINILLIMITISSLIIYYLIQR